MNTRVSVLVVKCFFFSALDHVEEKQSNPYDCSQISPNQKPKPSIMKWWHFFHHHYPRDFSRQGVSRIKVHFKTFCGGLAFSIESSIVAEYFDDIKYLFFEWVENEMSSYLQLINSCNTRIDDHIIIGLPFDHFMILILSDLNL